MTTCYDALVQKLNIHHKPAGPGGGQFTVGDGSGTLVAPTKPITDGRSTTEDVYRVKGEWWAPRKAYINAVCDRIIAKYTPPVGRPPIATILGGGTASGKSRFTRLITTGDSNVLPIDVDPLMKDYIPEYQQFQKENVETAAHRSHEEASYMAKTLLEKAKAKGLDLVY